MTEIVVLCGNSATIVNSRSRVANSHSHSRSQITPEGVTEIPNSHSRRTPQLGLHSEYTRVDCVCNCSRLKRDYIRSTMPALNVNKFYNTVYRVKLPRLAC